MSDLINITPGSSLTTLEQDALERLEGIISKGLRTFFEVGEALTEIRTRRLYRASHLTFEAYCNERWGFTRQRASQLISAAEVTLSLSTIVDTLPTTESQARELTSLSPTDAQQAWQRALIFAGDKQPTALDVRRAVSELRQSAEESPSPETSDINAYPQLRPNAYYLFSIRHSAILNTPYGYEGTAENELQRLIREGRCDVSWDVAMGTYIAHHYKGYQLVGLADLEPDTPSLEEDEEGSLDEPQYPFDQDGEDAEEDSDSDGDFDEPETPERHEEGPLAGLENDLWYLVNYDFQVIYLPGFPKWADANRHLNLNPSKALTKLHQGIGIRRSPTLRRFKTASLPASGMPPVAEDSIPEDPDAAYLDELLQELANAYQVIKPFAEGDPERFLAHLERKREYSAEMLTLFRSLVP